MKDSTVETTRTKTNLPPLAFPVGVVSKPEPEFANPEYVGTVKDGELRFPGGSVLIPQPTRAELLASAEAWVVTARQCLEGFAGLCESGDRAGCKIAIKSFLDSAQMVADRMLEASP